MNHLALLLYYNQFNNKVIEKKTQQRLDQSTESTFLGFFQKNASNRI